MHALDLYNFRHGNDYPPAPAPDAHYGRYHGSDPAVHLSSVAAALDQLKRIPRGSSYLPERAVAAAALDEAFAHETSERLADVVEAALECIAHREGQIGEDADDLLCAIEDRLDALRALIKGGE